MPFPDLSLVMFANPASLRLTPASVSFASSGDNTVVSATSGQTIRVMRLLLVPNGLVSVTMKDGASTSLSGVMQLASSIPFQLPLDGEPWFLTTAGNAFIINLSGAVQVSGVVWYTKS